MSANSAFFYLVALPGASCCTLHHSASPITPPIHFQGAAAVGYDGGTSLVIAQKRSPQHALTSEGFCAVTILSSGESIRRDSSAHLDPLHAVLVRPALGAVHDFTPCSCPARHRWRRPLERDPAEVAPENAKSGDLGGGVATP